MQTFVGEELPKILDNASFVAVRKPIPDMTVVRLVAETMDPDGVIMLDEFYKRTRFEDGPECLAFRCFPGGVCVSWEGGRGDWAFSRVAEVVSPLWRTVG